MDFEITKIPEVSAGPKISPSEEPQESMWGTLGRGIVRSGARSVETILGLPGDITEGISALVHGARRLVTGREQGPTKIDLSSGLLASINKGIKDLTGYESPFPSTFSIPNSEDIKEYITKPIGKLLPEKFLEPQNEWERVSDEIISDAIPLLVPIKGKIPFAKALKVSGLSNLSSWLAKQFGVEEKGQAVTKLGTTLLTTLGNPFALKKYANTLPKAEAAKFVKEVQESSKILNFISRYTNKAVNPVTGIVLGAYYGAGVPSALGIAGIYGAGVVERTLKAFSRNPALRKHYTSVLNAASKQNATLLIKNIKKLDNAMSKSLPDEPKDDIGDFEITKLSSSS